MCALNDEEMESSFKIDLRDVLWWKSIKDACKPGAPVIVKFSKERCISLATRGSHLTLHVSKIEASVGLPQPKKPIPPNTKLRAQIWNH